MQSPKVTTYRSTSMLTLMSERKQSKKINKLFAPLSKRNIRRINQKLKGQVTFWGRGGRGEQG